MQDIVTATECRGPWVTRAIPHLC